MNQISQKKTAAWNQKVQDDSNQEASHRLQAEINDLREEQVQNVRAMQSELNNNLSYQTNENSAKKNNEKFEDREAFNKQTGF